MHLPGPLRAAVGLAATAADELKHLPDRAIELPMLAVSTALQMSLRAQQRYARLAARGEQVLNREDAPSEDPPPWATFDDPVAVDDLRRSALSQLDSLIDDSGSGNDSELADLLGDDTDPAVGRMFESLFGVADPAANTNGGGRPDPADNPAAGAGDDTTATVTPISDAPGATRGRPPAAKAGAAPRKSARKTPRKTTTRKAAPAKKAPRKTAARQPDTTQPETQSKQTPDQPADKPVNKPRDKPPSKFDDAGDS